MTTVELAVDARCLLGEGPTWDAAAQRLWWVDVDGAAIHELDRAGNHRVAAVTSPTSIAVPDCHGDLVGTRANAVVVLDVGGVEQRELCRLPPAGDGRANDGRCDPQGRLWVGTVDRSGRGAAGLFCVGADGTSMQVRDGVGLSNGIDWSPDGRRCYHVDSLVRRVDELTLGDDGLPLSVRPLIETEYIPDGLSVDADGAIWLAAWDGGAVHRYTPDGRLDRTLAVPGGFVTSCAFGGAADTTLYITTARAGLPTHELAAQPLAGGLFVADVGVAGRGYTPFGAAAAPPPHTPASPLQNETDR